MSKVLTDKKVSKFKLPTSTNADVLAIKKKISRLKLEMSRNYGLNYNQYLQNSLKELSDYLCVMRQLESDFSKTFDTLQAKGRKEYQLRRFKEEQAKYFELTNWVFSRKFLRKFGIDKGITIYTGDTYKRVDDDGLMYNLVTVAEHPESTGLVVVMHTSKVNEPSFKQQSIFVELGEFINDFMLFDVSTPDLYDLHECTYCGEHNAI